MLHDDYPALWLFLGGYLHQDWDLDYETSDEALQAFVSSEQALAPRMATEVDDIFRLARTDAELDQLLVDFGCSYFPANACELTKEWLGRIGSQARLSTRPNGEPAQRPLE